MTGAVGLYVGETITDSSGVLAPGTTVTGIVSGTTFTTGNNASRAAAGDTLTITDAAISTVDLGGFDQEVDGLATGTALTSASNAVINNNGAAATFTVDNDATTTNADFSFGGMIQNGTGSLAFVKTGNNALTLSGTNAYAGGTVTSPSSSIAAPYQVARAASRPGRAASDGKSPGRHGGGGDPAFVDHRYRFIHDLANNVYFHSYFDYQAGDGHHQLAPSRMERSSPNSPGQPGNSANSSGCQGSRLLPPEFPFRRGE